MLRGRPRTVTFPVCAHGNAWAYRIALQSCTAIRTADFSRDCVRILREGNTIREEPVRVRSRRYRFRRVSLRFRATSRGRSRGRFSPNAPRVSMGGILQAAVAVSMYGPSHAGPSIRAHAAVSTQVIASPRPLLQPDNRSVSMKIRSAAAEFLRLRGRVSDPRTGSGVLQRVSSSASRLCALRRQTRRESGFDHRAGLDPWLL